jgi:hypothetical protein
LASARGSSSPERTRPRALAVLCGGLLALALVQFARVSVFMADSSRTAYALLPFSSWDTRHSCASAYFVAAQAAGEGQNVYDETLYSLPGDPSAQRKPRTIDRFNVDVYEYPPPFLLLPRAVLLVAPDFLGFRFVWFVLNALVVLVALVGVARAMGEPEATRALLLAPLVLAALPMLSALQKGNLQLVVVSLSMLAMLLIERERPAAGGLLLAYATASKLFPGLLLVYLLVRRRWRALGWTAAWGVVLTLAALADIGWPPFRAFFDHLPLLLGGEAFPAFRNPGAVANNFSIPGLVFKLKILGIGSLGFGASKIVGWVYTVVVLWATVALARRAHAARELPIVWLAIIVLASLRSPFLPPAYAAFPPVWLLSLLAAQRAPTARLALLTLGVWLALSVFVPIDVARPPTIALASFVPQAVTIAVAVSAVRLGLRQRVEGGSEPSVAMEPSAV